MTGSRGGIRYEPLPEDDPRQRRPDITLAGDKLGWQPKVTLDEGLVPTIAYFSDLIGERAGPPGRNRRPVLAVDPIER